MTNRWTTNITIRKLRQTKYVKGKELLIIKENRRERVINKISHINEWIEVIMNIKVIVINI